MKISKLNDKFKYLPKWEIHRDGWVDENGSLLKSLDDVMTHFDIYFLKVAPYLRELVPDGTKDTRLEYNRTLKDNGFAKYGKYFNNVKYPRSALVAKVCEYRCVKYDSLLDRLEEFRVNICINNDHYWPML
jgi:hypothetical protein